MELIKNDLFLFQGLVQIEYQDGTLEDGRYTGNKFVGIRRFFDEEKQFLNATLLRNGKIRFSWPKSVFEKNDCESDLQCFLILELIICNQVKLFYIFVLLFCGLLFG